MDGSSIDYAAGQVFSFDDDGASRLNFLQTIVYSGPRQRNSYQMNEFEEFCRFSGLPDTGIVWVDYIPQKKMVELKFLKNYFISFRNVGIYQEEVKSKIFNDLIPLLEPEEMRIKTRYSISGGIDTTCTINSNEQKF